MSHLIAPNGLVIQGTLEQLKGRSNIENPRRDENGELEFDWEGWTEVFWDESHTVINDAGQRIFLDEEGNEWPENQLELSE